MNFNITEEQQLLMESIQQFMERYAPESEVKKWYENHHVPTEVSKAFVEAGFGFLGVPEEYGGTPCDMVTLMMFAKEISRLTAGTMPFMSNILNMYDMLLLGTPEQIKMALDSYVETGESCFSLAISEPQAGSDNSSMTTTAKRVGDKIILNGTKTFVTHGDVSPMTIIVAKEEDPSRENKRMSMYMVPLNTKGISTSRLHKIGQGTTAFCEMYIDNVECDDSCLVGECGKGFLQLMQNFEIERLLICAQALGLAEAAMEDAAKYAAQRVQFNQPIYKFQQIQQMQKFCLANPRWDFFLQRSVSTPQWTDRRSMLSCILKTAARHCAQQLAVSVIMRAISQIRMTKNDKHSLPYRIYRKGRIKKQTRYGTRGLRLLR